LNFVCLMLRCTFLFGRVLVQDEHGNAGEVPWAQITAVAFDPFVERGNSKSNSQRAFQVVGRFAGWQIVTGLDGY